MSVGVAGRIAAVGVAVLAWVGLGLQFLLVYRENASILLTLWIVGAFFTITTNLLVATVFTAIATDRTMLRTDWVVAGTMLAILLVGIIYGLLLRGTVELSGGSEMANVLLHMVTPVIVPLFWMLFVRKGGLRWRHPLLWAVYPLAYLGYALARGAATGKYAYPFLNVTALGWLQIALNAVAIAVGFLLAGMAIVWFDHRVGSRVA